MKVRLLPWSCWGRSCACWRVWWPVVEEGSVISSGLQQLAQLLQHGRSVGRHRRVSHQIRRRDAHELREQLQSLRMLLKQTEQTENIRQASADHTLIRLASGTDRFRTSPPWPVKSASTPNQHFRTRSWSAIVCVRKQTRKNTPVINNQPKFFCEHFSRLELHLHR